MIAIFPIICLCLTVVYCDWNQDVYIYPDKFEDNDKPFAEFSCTADLNPGQWLSWYEEKKGEWLTTFKQGSRGGAKTIDLVLPLDNSNRGREIYCIKQNEVLYSGYKTISKSKNILIDFQRNVPPKKTDKPQVATETIVYGGGEPELEVTCWAYLRANERLSWYQEKGPNPTMLLTKIQDTNYGYVKLLLRITLKPNDIGTQIFCAHDTQKSQSRHIPITINRHPVDVWGPFVNPEPEYSETLAVDDETSVIEYTCSGYLYKGELLTWFQIKGSNSPKRLKMIQQSIEYGKLEIKLRKTLEATDIGTEMYCAKESIQSDQSITVNVNTKPIPIWRRGYIKPVETPYVNVNSSRDILILDEGETFNFDCNGSEPLDGRRYSWHIEGPNVQYRKGHLLYYYNEITKTSPVQSFMEQALHMSQVYCAQDNVLYLLLPDSNSRIQYFYNELVRSDPITLIYRYGYGNNYDKPLVTPKIYKDESKPFMELACYAFVQPLDRLTWFQTKESQPSPDDEILRRYQFIEGFNQFYSQWVNLTLKKTLEQSDKDTNIYCAKETIRDSIFSRSEMISITFNRYIKPMEKPYVTIEPDSDVIIYDEDQTLELNCSGSEPVDDRGYIWHIQGTNLQQIVPFHQSFDKTKPNKLELKLNKLNHRNLLYCAQDFTTFELDASDVKDRRVFSYGERVRSNMIILLHRTEGYSKDKPQVIPDKFRDKGKPSINFTCYAFLLPWEVLSWYQAIESNLHLILVSNSSERLLRTVQHQMSTKEGQWMTLTLNKTLDLSDNGSNVYCSKQSVLLNGNYSEESRSDSQPILLKFQRNIPRLYQYVTTEPKSKVYFEVNSFLSFSCSGSVPVDDSRYTWLRVDSYNKITIPKNQSYDTSTNINVLKLLLDETYHHNQLYCAQGFRWNVRASDGFHPKFFGEVAKSNMITLVQRGKDGGSNAMTLAVALPLALMALLAVLALWAVRKRRATPPTPKCTQESNTVIPGTLPAPHGKPVDAATPARRNESEDDGDYVNLTIDTNSTQVTYAVLDLMKKSSNIRETKPSTSAKIRGALKTSKTNGKTKKSKKSAKPATVGSSHYAEIIGVYKPPEPC